MALLFHDKAGNNLYTVQRTKTMNLWECHVTLHEAPNEQVYSLKKIFIVSVNDFPLIFHYQIVICIFLKPSSRNCSQYSFPSLNSCFQSNYILINLYLFVLIVKRQTNKANKKHVTIFSLLIFFINSKRNYYLLYILLCFCMITDWLSNVIHFI